MRESHYSSPERMRGELKSIEIPEVGKIEYDENFIELSQARKQELPGLEGFRVKRILSIGDRSRQQLVEPQETQVKKGLKELRQGAKENGDWESFYKKFIEGYWEDLRGVSENLKELEAAEKRKVLRMEYVLSEGRALTFGTLQHGVLAEPIIELRKTAPDTDEAEAIKTLVQSSILFAPYLPIGKLNYHFTQKEGRVIQTTDQYGDPTDELLESLGLDRTSAMEEVRKYGAEYKTYKKEVKEEIGNASIEMGRIACSAPYNGFYHWSPIVAFYGNENALFRKYLEEITNPSDPNVKKMMDLYYSGRQDRESSFLPLDNKNVKREIEEIMEVIPEQRPILEKEGGVHYIGRLGGGGIEDLKLLLERKPFMAFDMGIPVIQGYPNIPQFRLGAMAECIIDFRNLTVILPESKG